MSLVKKLYKKCLSYLIPAGNALEPVTTSETGLNTRAMMLSKSREEALLHWKYVEATLKAHNVSSSVAEYHYISAFMHGYLHGAEDQSTGRIKFEHKL